MRIGLVIYGSLEQNSGGYLYDRRLVSYLRLQGHRVEVISLLPRKYLSRLGDNFSSTLLSKIIDFKLDLLLEDELCHPSLFRLNTRIKAKLKIHIISIVHHLRSSEQHPAVMNAVYRAVEKRYLTSVDGFIYNSHTTRRVVASLLPTPKPGIVAQPGGDRFPPQVTAAQIYRRARKRGPLHVLFLGNLIRRKAPHLLLEAASRLERGLLQLTFAGGVSAEPGYVSHLKDIAKRYGLKPWVEFCGHLNDAQLVARLRSNQVLAVPSSYEGFGIAYLEGMGFGLPAIGCRTGAAPERIAHGKNGYLIDVGDISQLARTLQRLHKDRALLATLGIAARGRFNKQSTWEQSLDRIQVFLSSYNQPSAKLARRRKK